MKDNGNFPFLANQTGKFSSLWHHGKLSYWNYIRFFLSSWSFPLFNFKN